MTCRYDKAAEDYLRADGTTCRHDDYGDPTRHCTARRTCAQHIGEDELTCARCVGRTRQDLRQVVALAALMLPEAVARGTVDCEAANLAGPVGHPVVLSWRRVNDARTARDWQTVGDGSDDTSPALLTTWQMMLSEDYGHELPERVTVSSAGAYLDRVLHRVAQDPEQDYTLLAREIRKVRSHLESVLRNSKAPEKGAPCPECVAALQETRADLVARGVPEREWPRLKAPKLSREYGHWCESEDCERLHYDDDSADRWVCPRNRDHWWTHEDYARWIEDRREYVKRERMRA